MAAKRAHHQAGNGRINNLDYSVQVRRLAIQVEEPVRLTFVLLFGGLPVAFSLGAVEWASGTLGPITPWIIWGEVYLGVVPTALAVFLWTYAFSHLPAREASLTFFAQPVAGILLSAYLLGEQLPLAFYAGGALLGLGLWLVRDRTG